jgi:hypothetical protein
MTAVQTLRDTKAERLTDNFAPQERIETEETKTPQERYECWCREATERQRQSGLPDESPLTMEEIVAIVKEVRAERYAKKQQNSACH